MNAGVNDIFIRLVDENTNGIIDQAVFGIANLAAENYQYRDLLLKGGAVPSLVKVIK